MQIQLVKTPAEAQALVAQGYCPVECRWGDVVVLDDLQLDHHGDMAHLESVAIRAYRDFYAARAKDQRFVVNHVDRDNTLAIAALSGLLPHPNREVPPSMPAAAAKGLKRDITPLVQLCARLDVNPIGIDRVQEQFGDFDIFWGAVMNGPPSELQMYAGVFLWQRLTTGFPMNQLLRAAKAEEEDRIEKARQAEMVEFGTGVMAVESTVFGWDQWYQLKSEANPADPKSWKYPVVVAYVAIKEGISIGCPNPEVAKALFGPKGLIPVVQAILGPGAGGRPDFCGGEYERKYSKAEALEAARQISTMLAQKTDK